MNLQKQFPTLASSKILALPGRDYGFRIIAPKAVWGDVLKEMALEQTWSNFKNEASSFVTEIGSAYIGKLHDVWWAMVQLQKSANTR